VELKKGLIKIKKEVTTPAHLISSDTLEIAKQFASHVRRRLDSKAIIILFGSCAKGTFHPKSDIDIAVISSSFNNDIAENCGKLGSIIYDVNTTIETHPFSIDDWNYSTPFIYEIKKTGVILKVYQPLHTNAEAHVASVSRRCASSREKLYLVLQK
jgi:predicted nucleotidyltransferase